MTTGEIVNGRSDTPDAAGTKASAFKVTAGRAWGMTGLVIFLYVVNYADKAVLGIIAKPLKEDLGLTSSQIGLVGSLFFVTFTIGGFLAGPLNKYLTLRWALLALGLIWSVVMLPLVVSASLGLLIVCRMLLGLAEGPSSALMHAATYSWHPPAKRGLPGAFLAGSASVAKIALAPVLTYITVEYGWKMALIALSVLGGVWVLSWLSGWKEGPYTAKVVKGGDAASASTEPSVPWTKIFLNRTFASCALLIIVVYALTTVVLTWLPSYFQDGLGYSQLQAGSMFAFPSIVGLFLMIVSGSVTDRLAGKGTSSRVVRIIVPCVGVLICGAVLVFLPYIGTPALAVAAVSIGYGFGAIVFPLINAAISELCPPQQTAGTMGVFLALMAIGGLVAPYATGVIVDNAATPAEGYATAFQVIGVLGVIAAVLVLALANPDRDRKLIRSEA
ncbi:MFS transporter [Rhodococcus sp. HM1]|uniref:MFS transporter n=1 Tax=unclassified Rhodococcus (in: high G+C Gram-positive bacteria) TaxID=192944 RepID=UPI0018CE73D7|nr:MULTISPECIES: MFS transporter [unclassified Rhodococcus (in: high G+C Gram-positive bacteria)]MBH0119736.1 MFS transporter [Rhodococcus sp. CX]MCK8674770.1 MFS transporter [Rhodococcus sp. HM1]